MSFLPLALTPGSTILRTLPTFAELHVASALVARQWLPSGVGLRLLHIDGIAINEVYMSFPIKHHSIRHHAC